MTAQPDDTREFPHADEQTADAVTPAIAKPASWRALVDTLTPQIHQRLKTAVELGRWPNGERLTPEQVEFCLQAVIAWDQQHLPESERVAWIERGKPTSCHNGDD